MGTKPRVPPEAGGIQVNTCHNPLCPQYGRHPQNNADGKKIRDGFRVVGTGGGQKALHCAACGRYNRLRSNQAICEELERLWAPHVPPLGPACKNNDCENRHHPLRLHPYEYAGFGTNSSGSRRYRQGPLTDWIPLFRVGPHKYRLKSIQELYARRFRTGRRREAGAARSMCP